MENKNGRKVVKEKKKIGEKTEGSGEIYIYIVFRGSPCKHKKSVVARMSSTTKWSHCGVHVHYRRREQQEKASHLGQRHDGVNGVEEIHYLFCATNMGLLLDSSRSPLFFTGNGLPIRGKDSLLKHPSCKNLKHSPPFFHSLILCYLVWVV